MEARALHLEDPQAHRGPEDTDDHTHDLDGNRYPEPLGLAPDPVEIRRNGGLAALLGVVASAIGIAYLARATGTGAVVDWALFAVMAVLGVTYLLAFVDARTPLLVADTQGVRIRLGRSWRGIPWGALAHVEHLPRRGLLRDGRLVLVARNPERVLAELDPRGRRQSRVAQRLYGAPFALPLALSTRVSGAGEDLTGALVRLAGDPGLVVEVAPEPASEPASWSEPEPEPESEPGRVSEQDELLGTEDRHAEASWEVAAPRELDADLDADLDAAHDERLDEDLEREERTTASWPDPRPGLARGISALASRLPRRGRLRTETDDDLDLEPGSELEPEPRTQEHAQPQVVASPTPEPLREPTRAARAELLREQPAGASDEADGLDEAGGPTGGRELRRPGSVSLVEDPLAWGDRVRPIARGGSAVEPLVIDDFTVEPAEDPVVGPELTAARTRLGLSVDQLAERTRIRPHVIESIEVDDFAPCGGDFYARGHLRTLARVLGIDAAPLLTCYDERYADAPINPRRVFEAELATGSHGFRGTRGGPNWSVLIAAVMTVVLVWSVARLVMDSPVELAPPTPRLNGSAGVDNTLRLGDPVPVVLTAKGGTHVVVHDGSGDVAWSGDLSIGQRHTLRSVAPPVQVQASDGALEVSVDGEPQGAVGDEGQPAQETYPVK